MKRTLALKCAALTCIFLQVFLPIEECSCAPVDTQVFAHCKAVYAGCMDTLHIDSEPPAPQTSMLHVAHLITVRPIINGLLRWQSRRVREFIEANIGGTIRVRDMSEIAQRSVSHFSRAFKITFGEAPHTYLVRRRIEMASELLLASEHSLCGIALRCGFADQAHLTKQFRQWVGASPAAWRREQMRLKPRPAPSVCG
jgi:AraC-like DNA-binding protein